MNVQSRLARLARLAPAALLLLCSSACRDTSPSAPESEPTASSQSAIAGGKKVNESHDWISTQFPMSTVHLFTPAPGSPPGTGGDYGTGNGEMCSGVIVSPTQILTAAHCKPDTTTIVYLYGSTGAYPVSHIPTSQIVAPMTEWGVINCDPKDPSTSCKNLNDQTWADLAIVTLDTPLAKPYAAAKLAPMGQYEAMRTSEATWAVGTGFTSGGEDPGQMAEMQWVAALLTANVGWGGAGSFESANLYCDGGDSGGPLYQLSGNPDAGPFNLVILGICSSSYMGNEQRQVNEYTSTQYSTNYQWLNSKINPYALDPFEAARDHSRAILPTLGDGTTKPLENDHAILSAPTL